MKEQIDELALEWDCGSTFQDSQIKSVVLEHLQPSTNLKSLTIKGCGGISFPNWLGDFSFSNMVYLKILKLCICGFNDKSIDGMSLQHLSSLKNLEIVNAPNLKSLPKELPSSLSVLSITRCPLLVATLRRKRGKEWRKIAHILAIIIDDELIT
ncbi:unnamed protein product [Lathyrus oleraceus]|uniref:R13L1/DRL21-like LRR repeat region domain-containing protein n=1 Tax=Pisum sativum TaxID=3888 RepID=A0A9D4X1X2_PEA|nr:hypothetical protein KIW84_056089 [Pisum sativum]